MRLGLEAGAHTHELAVEEGIRGVPIGIDQLVDAGVEARLAPLKEKGLEVCQIGAFGYNPLSTDAEEQKKQAETLEKGIPLAAATGCPYIVICGGNYHPSGFAAGDRRNFTEEALDLLAEGLKPMLALAEEHGARLSIEPYLKTAVNSAERFLALKERVGSDALRINVDVTSLYDYGDLWDPGDKAERFCTALAGHFGLGHIKEVALKEGFHIQAGLAPLGEGVTDWEEMLKLMAPRMPEDSWVILEHVLSVDEGKNSLALLRAAARRAGVELA